MAIGWRDLLLAIQRSVWVRGFGWLSCYFLSFVLNLGCCGFYGWITHLVQFTVAKSYLKSLLSHSVDVNTYKR